MALSPFRRQGETADLKLGPQGGREHAVALFFVRQIQRDRGQLLSPQTDVGELTVAELAQFANRRSPAPFSGQIIEDLRQETQHATLQRDHSSGSIVLLAKRSSGSGGAFKMTNDDNAQPRATGAAFAVRCGSRCAGRSGTW